MKVYINRLPRGGPYGGGNLFVTAFHKRAADICELLLDPTLNINPDVILLAGLDNDGTGISIDQAVLYKMYMEGHHNTKIVVRVNENDARKGTNHVDALLLKVSAHIDGTVFVSNWLKRYFNDKGWACNNQIVIVNGCAADVFKPQPKLSNGKVNIVSAHWSDNPMKGQDITEWLDGFVGAHPDEFTFTFIGRTKANLQHSTYVRPLAGSQLATELAKHDVCINGTRFDPGPNSVIEPITCGLPTYVHADGGGAIEFAGDDHVFRTTGELETLLLTKQFTPNTTSFPSWMETIRKYVAYMEQVVGS